MTIQQEIENLKHQIAELQEELKTLEQCEEEDARIPAQSAKG